MSKNKPLFLRIEFCKILLITFLTLVLRQLPQGQQGGGGGDNSVVLVVSPQLYIRTNGGAYMPKLIYGTAWKKEKTRDLTIQAILAGFKGIDTACQTMDYNEPGVGEALKILEKVHNITRQSLFIQTKFTSLLDQDPNPNKIPYDKNAGLAEQVSQSIAVSLKNLNTTYIDSLVLHGPLSTFNETMTVWRAFETHFDSGIIRQLGISNCYEASMLIKLYKESRVKPSVIQNRFYSETGYDKDIRKFCKEKNIIYQSFWTLTANYVKILQNPKVLKMSWVRKKTPEQLFFAYLIKRGFAPLTGTSSKIHMIQDLEAITMSLQDYELKIFDKFIN